MRESWLVLVLGTVFAMLLAGAQAQLQPLIDQNRAAVLSEAIAEVVPAMDAARLPEKLVVDRNDVYRCFDSSGQIAGYAVRAFGPGFVDRITLVVGLSPELDRVLGVRVIEHSETPGLGTKINPGYPFPEQFREKGADVKLVVEKRPPRAPQEVEAITGATWSSVYVTDIVNDVNQRVRPALQALLAAEPEGSR